MNRAARIAAVVAGVGGVLALHVALIGREVYRAPSVVEQKIAGADRVVAYRVTRSEGPRFGLTGSERVLDVVTHAVLLAPGYDPRAQVTYGLRFVVQGAGGKEIWSREVFANSRVSKSGRNGVGWNRENTFTSDGASITDARHTALTLPGSFPADAVLAVTLAGGPDEVLMRAYDVTSRGAAGSAAHALLLAPDARERLAERLTVTPFDALDPSERASLDAQAKDRLAALGNNGSDYSTRDVLVSEFHESIAFLEAENGLLLDATHAVALDVEGPADITLRVTREHGESGDGGAEVRCVPACESAPSRLDLPEKLDSAILEARIGAGVHSLHVSSAGHAGLRLHATGSVPGFGTQPSVRDGGAFALVPDERRLRADLATPGGPAVEFDLERAGDSASTALRLDAWRVVPEADALKPGIWHARISAELRDAQGVVLGHEELSLDGTPAFEDHAWSPDGEPAAISAPVSLRFVLPARARRVALRASVPVALRAWTQGTRPARADRIAPPYGPPPAGTSWRYVPRDNDAWRPLSATNEDALEEEEQVRTLVAQTRLEAAEPGVATPEVQPAGGERQIAFEPIPLDRVRDILTIWGPGTWTALPAGEAASLDMGRAIPGRPSVQYWTNAAALGKKVEFELDGKPLARFPLIATRGSWRLPPIVPGVHVLRAVSAAAELQMAIDQPPASGAAHDLYRERALVSLARGPLVWTVAKRTAAPVALNLVIYDMRSGPDPDGAISIEIDDGAPRAATLTRQEIPMPTADAETTAPFAEIKGRVAGMPRLVPIPLGSDLGVGPHTIRVSGPGRLWLRGYVVDPAAPRDVHAFDWGVLEPLAGSAGGGG